MNVPRKRRFPRRPIVRRIAPGVNAAGNYAYVTCERNDRLTVVDISDHGVP